MRIREWMVLPIVVLLHGCGSSPTCEPRESRACTCPGGESGVQVCSDDGRWEDCTCLSSDADTDGDVATEVDEPVADPVEEDGPVVCTEDGDCDDGDPCTSDACDTDDGLCVHDVVDADEDGYGAIEADGEECGGTDCDDDDELVHPGAEHGCEESDDQDCDGLSDLDEDGDGFSSTACGGGDCDDEDDRVFPGSMDRDCNDEDRDCNGHPDRDNDGDGENSRPCDGPDCDDEDATVLSSATEIECDGKDTDCDGFMHVTEDADRDGYANETCVASGLEADCDDTLVTVYPGAPEVCDMVDQDCDGSWADGGADDDGDLHLDDSCGGDDCDDTRSDTYLGAVEICSDGIDQDCDGSADGFTRMLDDVRITTTTGWSDEPSLAWSGSEYGAVWSQSLSGQGEIYFVRVSAAGARVGADERITTTPFGSEKPSLVWSGSEYGLVWTDSSYTSPGTFFLRLSTTGSVLGTQERLSDISEAAMAASIAWTGSQYASAWYGDQSGWMEIMFARVTAAGSLIGSQVRVTTEIRPSWFTDIAWTGSQFGVAWLNEFSPVQFARLSDAGVKIGSDSAVASSSLTLHEPALAWSGSEYGVSWTSHGSSSTEGGTFFARVAASGAAVGTETRISSMAMLTDDAALLWTGSGYAAAWRDARAGTADIYLAHLSPAGARTGSEIMVSNTTYSCFNPSIAWSGSEVGVIWADIRSGEYELYFNRIAFCE